MLSGDNSILGKAGVAKTETEKVQAIEQAQVEIMGKITENKGDDPQESDVKEILEKYFTNVPESLDDLTQDMKTKKGEHIVKLEDVLKGITFKKEVKETPIKKSTEKTDSYVGYYADIDNDGDVDGIIYADMVVGNTKSGRWNNDTEGWSDYDVTKIEDATTAKDYIVSTRTYEGQTEAGKYNFKPKEDEEGFGEKEVLVPATNSIGTKDRFYVMQLTDFTNNSKNSFYWYYDAYNKKKLDRDVASSVNDFGQGKQNTINMIDDWTNKTSTYGEQTTASSGKDYIDLWGAIQDGQYSIVSSATDSGKWFVPSKAEWSAFGEELGIKPDNYVNKGLSYCYWSSSQHSTNSAYNANFFGGYDGQFHVTSDRYVRMSTTF